MTTAAEPLAYIVSLGEEAAPLRLPLGGRSFTIGRDTANQLCITDDPTVSRQHCIIHAVGTTLMMEDLRSRNGTYLNGRRVSEPIAVPVPSTLMVGRTRLAVVPARAQQDDVTSVVETAYARDGSIIIPPSVFLKVRTDALLVVDVFKSSELVAKSQSHFFRMMHVMGKLIERHLREEAEPFMKSTGDGFFACFGTATGAFDAAVGLGNELEERFPMEEWLPLKVVLSVGLHWGMTHLNDQGDRIGANAHAVFSVEDLRHREPSLQNDMESRRLRALVLMTEPFCMELDDARRSRTTLLGEYRLKGMEDGLRIYRWRDTGDTGVTQPSEA
jgi:pSer/pThr/pTyr-binding forkhead associated (FHA) protein